MPNFVKVAQTHDVPPGTGKAVNVDGTLIALFNIDGTFYAIDNTCPHRGGPLGEGFVEGDIVTCPWHGWRYSVKTGSHLFNQQIQVRSFPVVVENTDVKVSLEP